VLESLTRLSDELEIESNTSNTTSNVTVFPYRTFALQFQTIDPSSFKGQIFNIDLGSVEEAKKIKGSIDDTALITLENTTNVLNNATASIYISEELLEYCFNNAKEGLRLSYTVFLSDAFFQTANSSKKIVSLTVAARVNCSDNNTLPVGINATFRFNKNVFRKVYCSY
jgi:hypothetical protein